MPRIRRTATVLATAVVLLLPSAAYADDDPTPPEWPTVQDPGTGGSGSDPQPLEWPAPEPL